MTTTRRDLDRIARSLRDSRPEQAPGRRWSSRYAGWIRAVDAVADALHDTTGLNINGNRRFDRDRFMAAVGIPEVDR